MANYLLIIKYFDAFLNEKFILLLTNEVILEYFEVIAGKANLVVGENFIMSLITAENNILQEIFFRWSLIETDMADNKFCDLAIAGNAFLDILKIL